MADRSVQMHAIAGASGAAITGVDLAQHRPINGYDAWRGAIHRVTLAGGQPR